MKESLQLRLRLVKAVFVNVIFLSFYSSAAVFKVAGLFETVCRSRDVEQWALLLFQMCQYRLVRVDWDRRLYDACIDMLCALIHSIQLPAGAAFQQNGSAVCGGDSSTAGIGNNTAVPSQTTSPAENKNYISLIKRLKV